MVLDSGAAYLFYLVILGSVGWVAGVEDSVGDYCFLMRRSDCSLASALPEVVNDMVKHSGWTWDNLVENGDLVQMKSNGA